MAPLTGRIACVFYLLLMSYSTEASLQKLPNCKKKLGSIAIQNDKIRENLAVGVIVAMRQIQGPVYICEMERRAYKFVGAGGNSTTTTKNVVLDQGTGRLNLKEVLSKWDDKLKNMGNKKKFGCNLSINDEGYKVACVFK
ncbi:hypothetical protein Aduo_014494 [Ancylostoma duodenale]